VLRDALDAFARLDVDAAIEVAGRDAEKDEEYESIIRQLMTYMMEDPRSISNVMDLIWSARSLERIGDHAHNLCEYVIYLVEGTDVRHLSVEKIEEVLDRD
jgi:phosphate transport system protein